MTRHIKLGTHTWFQIKMRPVTSLDIEIPSLALYSFVFLYYLFCYFCSDRLTCLFYILFDFFLRIEITKILLIIITDTIIANKNQSQLSRNSLFRFMIPPLLLSTLTYFD